jgi:hypothetical protein
VTTNVGPSLVKYKHGRQLIVASPEDQLLLRQTIMMSGWQMLMFNRMLFGLIGISNDSTSTTLAALQPSHVFRVARWTQVIELRVSKLFEDQVFLPSSSSTFLDDSNIVIRFGGDKVGKKMAFKGGFTVMNTPKPNSCTALDLLATRKLLINITTYVMLYSNIT